MNAKQYDTKALQELDKQHYMHPFTDSKAMHEKVRALLPALMVVIYTTLMAVKYWMVWRVFGV
jgi:hypothetical protein